MSSLLVLKFYGKSLFGSERLFPRPRPVRLLESQAMYEEESVHYVVQTCHVTGVSGYVLRAKSSFSVCMKLTLTLKLPRASDHSYAE